MDKDSNFNTFYFNNQVFLIAMMAQKWAVAALLRAEKKFRRVKGYKDAAVLQQKALDGKEAAA
jgi:hypothetical protein